MSRHTIGLCSPQTVTGRGFPESPGECLSHTHVTQDMSIGDVRDGSCGLWHVHVLQWPLGMENACRLLFNRDF